MSETPSSSAPGAPAAGRRWWKLAVWVVAAVVVILGAAEIAIRVIAPNIITSTIREQLSLTEDHPVDVSLGGSAVLHAFSGALGDVSVSVAEVPVFDDIVISLAAHADVMPFDVKSRPLEGGTATLTIPKDQLGPVISLATSGIASTGTVKAGELEVGRNITLFGQDVPVTASVALSIVDGALAIDPRGVTAAGFDLSAKELHRMTGSLLDGVLQPHTLCVQDRIPAGITLTGIELSSLGSIRVDAALAPTLLTDPSQQALGTCA